MIRGLHGLMYSSDADATRAFFRDQMKLPFSDTGDGWLIFDLPEGDLGIHPIDHGGTAGDHDVSFYCDDIQKTVRDLESRGVTFKGDIEDHGYGLVTYVDVPGGLTVQLYEPRYTKTTTMRGKARAATKKGGAKKGGAKKGGAKKGGAKKGGAKKKR